MAARGVAHRIAASRPRSREHIISPDLPTNTIVTSAVGAKTSGGNEKNPRAQLLRSVRILDRERSDGRRCRLNRLPFTTNLESLNRFSLRRILSRVYEDSDTPPRCGGCCHRVRTPTDHRCFADRRGHTRERRGDSARSAYSKGTADTGSSKTAGHSFRKQPLEQGFRSQPRNGPDPIRWTG